jgi:hypothetical protein
LIITDLLELPFRQGERETRRDALTEEILSAPELQVRLNGRCHVNLGMRSSGVDGPA